MWNELLLGFIKCVDCVPGMKALDIHKAFLALGSVLICWEALIK